MSAMREREFRRVVEHVLDAVGLWGARLGLGRLAEWLGRPLLVPSAVQPAPAIVVLCGGCRFNGRLNEATRARVEHGVRLYQQGLAPRLILSGGRPNPHRPNCAVRMRALALDLGVPAERILVEDRSSRTVENAREVAALLRGSAAASALLVTSAHHMRRARRCFERQGIRVWCAPPPGVGTASLLVKEVAHECLGLVYYRLRGW